MSATNKQQLAELRRANETLLKERDAARAELRARAAGSRQHDGEWDHDDSQATMAGFATLEAEIEELRAAQAAGLEVLQTMAASPGETEPAFDLIARQAAKLCEVQHLGRGADHALEVLAERP